MTKHRHIELQGILDIKIGPCQKA